MPMLHYSTQHLVGVLKSAAGSGRIREHAFTKLLARSALDCKCPPPKPSKRYPSAEEDEMCRHVYDIKTCLIPMLVREGLLRLLPSGYAEVPLTCVDLTAAALRQQLKTTEIDEERCFLAEGLARSMHMFDPA